MERAPKPLPLLLLVVTQRPTVYIYIRTVSSTALISHKSYYEKSKKKSRERLLLFSTKTQSIHILWDSKFLALVACFFE